MTTDEQVACSLCEDEGEVSPCDMDADELYDCPHCLRAEGIALRVECATKAMEIERLRVQLRQINALEDVPHVDDRTKIATMAAMARALLT